MFNKKIKYPEIEYPEFLKEEDIHNLYCAKIKYIASMSLDENNEWVSSLTSPDHLDQLTIVKMNSTETHGFDIRNQKALPWFCICAKHGNSYGKFLKDAEKDFIISTIVPLENVNEQFNLGMPQFITPQQAKLYVKQIREKYKQMCEQSKQDKETEKQL